MKEVKEEFIVRVESPCGTGDKMPESVMDLYSRLWSEVQEDLSALILEVDVEKVLICIDWAPVISNFQYWNRIERMPIKEAITLLEEIDFGEHQKVEFNCSVRYASADNTLSKAGAYLEIAFYYIFLIMNISAPGSFNLSKAVIANTKMDSEIRLNPYFIGSAWFYITNNGWPSLTYVPLKQVVEWFYKMNIGVKQVAQTRIERAIFALLHTSQENGSNPTMLLWIAHALEALYDTQNEAIGRTLQRRILMVLGEPERDSRKVKKGIADFYKLRSKFVHGELDIHHPASFESIDKNLDPYFLNLWHTCDFAFALVMATFQKMASNGWVNLNFQENYVGE